MSSIYICLATDNNYVQLASVAIESILENNEFVDNIEFFILDSGINKNNKDIIRNQIKNKNRKVYFYNVLEELNKIKAYGANSQGRFNSYACYARFFVIEKLPLYVDKLLYLDCDTCICDNLEELFETNLNNYLLGGVLDILPDFHKRYINFNSTDYYFNSGVLLFNCDIWRQEGTLEKIKEILLKENNTYSFHDQDIINIVCKNRIKILHPRYMVFLPEYSWGKKNLIKLTNLSTDTYYTEQDIEEAVKKPCIIHYVNSLFGRPWFTNNNGKYDFIWKKYLKNSPFNNNFQYIGNKVSTKHKIFLLIYKIIPRSMFVKMFRRRRNKILIKKEIENEEKYNN